MRTNAALAFFGLVSLISPISLHADTIAIAGDPNAPTSNFGSPGNTATFPYSITVSGDGTSVFVALTTTDMRALDAANLYFETVAGAGTGSGLSASAGSNLGFEVGAHAVNDAFIPGIYHRYNTALPGFSSVETFGPSSKTITVTLPDSFFLTDPDGMGFTIPTAGSNISLHFSQSFAYSVVGGSDNFGTDELGTAEVGTAVTPEPSSLGLLGTGILGIAGVARRRFLAT